MGSSKFSGFIIIRIGSNQSFNSNLIFANEEIEIEAETCQVRYQVIGIDRLGAEIQIFVHQLMFFLHYCEEQSNCT